MFQRIELHLARRLELEMVWQRFQETDENPGAVACLNYGFCIAHLGRQCLQRSNPDEYDDLVSISDDNGCIYTRPWRL